MSVSQEESSAKSLSDLSGEDVNDLQGLHQALTRRFQKSGLNSAEIDEWIGAIDTPNPLACIRLSLDSRHSPAGLQIHDAVCAWNQEHIAPGDPTKLKCQQCGSDVHDGYCSDATCAYSDWPQSIPKSVMQSCSADEITLRYGIEKRQRPEPG